MVRPANLKLALLTAGVLVGHVVALEWIARVADQISGLTLMAPPMYTRMLQPAAPPPAAAVAARAPARPQPRAAAQPRPPASSAEALRRQAEERARREDDERAQAEAKARADRVRAEAQAQAEEAARQQRLAEAAAAAQAAAAGSAAQAAASAPQASASASAPAADAAALDRWPEDTRLSYALTGQYRGPLYGDARVQWQRQGERYQVRLDARIQLFGTQVLTSQGEVTPDGLVPRAYEELRPGKRRSVQFGDQVVVLENGRTVPRPAGVQDTASQFVELTQRFATGREVLEVGRSVSLWLARPGGVDRWVYDVVGRDLLRTPQFGLVEAYHLKPRPASSPRGNIYVEMWFAPSLQYLPARIRMTMGEEAYLDLVVDHIEQR